MLIKENYDLGNAVYCITSNYTEFFRDYDPYGCSLSDPEAIMSIHQMITDLEAGNVAPYIDILQDIESDDEDTAETIADLIEYLSDYKADYDSWKGE